MRRQDFRHWSPSRSKRRSSSESRLGCTGVLLPKLIPFYALDFCVMPWYISLWRMIVWFNESANGKIDSVNRDHVAKWIGDCAVEEF